MSFSCLSCCFSALLTFIRIEKLRKKFLEPKKKNFVSPVNCYSRLRAGNRKEFRDIREI